MNGLPDFTTAFREMVRCFRARPIMSAADALWPLERAIQQLSALLFSYCNYVGRKPTAAPANR